MLPHYAFFSRHTPDAFMPLIAVTPRHCLFFEMLAAAAADEPPPLPPLPLLLITEMPPPAGHTVPYNSHSQYNTPIFF